MDLSDKIDVLDRIYKIYDSFTDGLELACQKYCSTCCTRNVTMTTLEGYKIADHLIENGKSELFKKIKDKSYKKRFQPIITTNKIADLCIQGKELPDEEIDSSWGSCPLLINDECPIYTARPFGCRCFVSKHSCSEKGYAKVDEFILSVNNIFLQYIEHIDSQGCSGNLLDVLLYFESSEGRQNYRDGVSNCAENNLVSNRSIPALMIPPEHRLKIQPILQAILSAWSQE